MARGQKTQKTQKERADAALREYIVVHLLRMDMLKKELAEILGIHPVVLSRKLGDPDKFTRKEMRRVYDVLHFTREEIADTYFGQ